MKTYEELKKTVDENQGVLTVNMEVLRDLHGAAKLGIHVRSNISNELAGRGLGHYPEELPDRQHASARVYTLGSPVADVINAVLNVDERKDAFIRKAASNSRSRVLDKIRELLDED